LLNAKLKLFKPNSASKAVTSVSESVLSSDVPAFVDVALPDQGAGVTHTVFNLAHFLNSDTTGNTATAALRYQKW
jgi:hypothetical protein